MQTPNKTLIKKTAIGLVLIALILTIGHELKLYLPDLEAWVQQLGFYAPVGFIALFVALTPLLVSVDALCFAAGLLFTLDIGEVCIILATYCSAALIFMLGRHCLRDKVVNFLAKHQRFAALDSVISGEDAFKLMFLLRLTPLPFALLSYALSVTKVKFWPYWVATGILIYNGSLVYLGYTTKHLSGLIQGAAPASHVSYPLLAVGFVLAIVVLITITKKAEQRLKQLNLE